MSSLKKVRFFNINIDISALGNFDCHWDKFYENLYYINAVIFTIFTKEPPVTFVGTGIVFREKKIRSVLHKS